MKQPNSRLPVWKLALLDLLAAALILAVFVLFKLGVPYWRAASRPTPAPVPAAPVTTPPPTAAPAPTAPPEAEETPEPTPEPTPDTRTEWQIRFADQFTETPVLTENSYTSPEVSVRIDTVTVDYGGHPTVCHIADIYVASLDNFRTWTANDELRYFSTQDVMEMDAAANAILAISGDFYCYQSWGFLMRNGELYRADQTGCDILVLYEDGRMETLGPRDYKVQDVLDAGAVQVWNFGPALLDAEGHVKDSYDVSTTVGFPNPRSAVGYYEPGHYCFLVADGRQQDYSRGLRVPELAEVFEGLGCKCAYNLDGGGSAVMLFDHDRFSRQSNGADRKLGDILYITDSYFGKGETEP